MHVPKDLKTIHKHLSDAGYSVYIVGGAVRNHIAGIPPTDYDLATSATPDTVMRLFRRTVPTGVAHGTVTILLGKNQYEITTFRTESDYSDSRHPDSVSYAATIEEDLSRRDFTMNALAWDLEHNRLIDLFDGRNAIRSGIIKAIGTPAERFAEDPLRIMRACRFVAELGFTVEEATRRAAASQAADLGRISIERLRDELIKLVTGSYCSRGLFLMRDIGVLHQILPELEACIGVEQQGVHAFDVFEHSVYSCEGVPATRPELRLAALFHDLGKPDTAGLDDSGNRNFHRHERVGAKKARDILERFKFPRQTIKSVSHLIGEHMFNYTSDWGDTAVRRFVARVGPENLDDLFAVRAADSYGMQRRAEKKLDLTELHRRVDELIARNEALSLKDLALNGRDLAAAGIPPGRLMGVVLQELLETVLDDPDMNQKERLLPLAQKLYQQLRSRQ